VGRDEADGWRGAALARAKGPRIFSPARGRQNTGLNKRLPGITQRDVLPSARFD
jgi:hypothetical protein